MHDDVLWSRALDGDGEAFGSLFDRHRARAFGHACRLVESRHDAEDVTAAAFLELWRRRGDVRLVEGSVLPWLLVTVGNLARNAWRGTRRHRSFLDRLPRQASTPDASEVFLARGIDRDLRAALATLGQTDLHLVSLVALESCSLAEAAAALNLSPSAAKARYHRARHRRRAHSGLRSRRQDGDRGVPAAPLRRGTGSCCGA